MWLILAISFDLLNCSSGPAAQKFIYNADTLGFIPAADLSLCITADVQVSLRGFFCPTHEN
jgi:hypothetical protein